VHLSTFLSDTKDVDLGDAFHLELLKQIICQSLPPFSSQQNSCCSGLCHPFAPVTLLPPAEHSYTLVTGPGA